MVKAALANPRELSPTAERIVSAKLLSLQAGEVYMPPACSLGMKGSITNRGRPRAVVATYGYHQWQQGRRGSRRTSAAKAHKGAARHRHTSCRWPGVCANTSCVPCQSQPGALQKGRPQASAEVDCGRDSGSQYTTKPPACLVPPFAAI
eukprot:460872-Pleurochrysis_carterae.AAC.2